MESSTWVGNWFLGFLRGEKSSDVMAIVKSQPERVEERKAQERIDPQYIKSVMTRTFRLSWGWQVFE